MSDGFSVPDFDSVKEFGALPEKGWHPSSLVQMESKKSKSGNAMLVSNMVIDAGESVGYKLKEYFVVSGQSKIGWEKLKKLANNAGFSWEPVKTPALLADQFVDMDDCLRVDIFIDYDYSIKDGSTWKGGVSLEEYERWTAQGGDGSKKAVIKNYREVSQDAEMVLKPSNASEDEEEEKGMPGSKDIPDSQDVNTDEEEDDELPF